MPNIKKLIKNICSSIFPSYRLSLRLEQKLNRLEKEIYVPSHCTLLRLEQKLNQLENKIHSLETKNFQFYFWNLYANGQNLADAKKRFWDNFPKATGDMSIIQNCNLYMMKEFHKICETNGLNYWLHGGTLIGGVRHKGFIPWDDDVDFSMPREDLEKLIEITKKTGDFEVCVYYHADNNFSRAYQFKFKDKRICNFVDIFVFDYYDEKSASDFGSKFITTRNQLVQSFLDQYYKTVKVLPVSGNYFGSLEGNSKRDVDALIENHLNQMGNYRAGDFLYYSIENYPFPYPLLRKDDIFPLQKIPYEDTFLYAPANYNKVLSGYGDIMNIPSDVGAAAHLPYFQRGLTDMIAFLESLPK